MKKQPTIADVLHLAADKYLVAHTRWGEGIIKEKFSCCAVDEAICDSYDGLYDGEAAALQGEAAALQKRVMKGLKNMGCDIGSQTLFKKYGDNHRDYSAINHEVQGMRYMWLKWAALMAEEQGV